MGLDPSGRDFGIIPAYAGSTSRTCGAPSGFRDHPRVCGEHGRFPWQHAHPQGSSPRMRGAPVVPGRIGDNVWIIPAYAGSTLSLSVSAELTTDHPRVCGEHLGTFHRGDAGGGSSPRMRGAPIRIYVPETYGGIIPAYAGSTIMKALRKQAERDHPRVCGEHHATRPSLPMP